MIEWPCEECPNNLDYVCSGQAYCERVKEYKAAQGFSFGNESE